MACNRRCSDHRHMDCRDILRMDRDNPRDTDRWDNDRWDRDRTDWDRTDRDRSDFFRSDMHRRRRRRRRVKIIGVPRRRF